MKPRNLADYDCGKSWELMFHGEACDFRNDRRIMDSFLVEASKGERMAYGAREGIHFMDYAEFNGVDDNEDLI